MKRGDSVIVTRYGKPGQPRPGTPPIVESGVIVKSNGSTAVVQIGDVRRWIRKDKIAPQEQAIG